jgi:hypothetical protein
MVEAPSLGSAGNFNISFRKTQTFFLRVVTGPIGLLFLPQDENQVEGVNI